MNTLVHQEKRFDRGAWLVVASMALFAFIVIFPTLYILRMPGDGWQNVYEEPPLNDFVGDWTTPLKRGDVVLAVDDVSVAFEFVPTIREAPPSWLDGSTVTYTIDRNGREQKIGVMLHVLPVWGILKAVSNTVRADLPQLSWFIIGLIVFILRPGSTAARLFFIAGTSLALVSRIGWAATTVSANFAPPIAWFLQLMTGTFWGWLFFPSLILLLLVFPKPLWTPSRFQGLITGLLFLIPLVLTIATIVTGQIILADIMLGAEALIIFVVAITAVVQAFRRRRDPVIRAQVSWVAFGIAVSIGGTLVAYLLEYSGLVVLDGFSIFWSWVITLALPVCMAIVILRYRLFDIQVIIRKTLVYTVVTALLAMVYFGLVIILQGIFDSISGQQSPIIIVLSTLAIAALFAPLRNRVQKIIDRRFFRKNYDSEQVLGQFAQVVQNETNGEEIETELMRVIQDTIEPELISLSLLKIRQES